jgi:hypothetical protein
MAPPARSRTCVAPPSEQIGTCHRLELTGDGVPERLVAKLPAADTGMRAMLAGAYRGEVRFYTDLAATVSVRAPRCHFAALGDDGNFTLLLEDLAPARQGDQIRGCTPAEALDAVRNLADLHAPRWNDADLLGLEWLGRPDEAQARMLSELYGPAVDTFVADLGDLLDDSDSDTLRSCVDATEQWMTARSERFTVLHGDTNTIWSPRTTAGSWSAAWNAMRSPSAGTTTASALCKVRSSLYSGAPSAPGPNGVTGCSLPW